MAINLLKREGWGGTFDVSVSNDDRAFHTYVVGKTGVGKSTFLKQLLIQEIQNGAGVGLIDPHGDLATELLEHIPRTRFQDVVYFNPADPTHSAPLNILKASPRPDLVASSVVGALRNISSDRFVTGSALNTSLTTARFSSPICQKVSSGKKKAAS